MYEQISHSVLNDILDELKAEYQHDEFQHFFIRLGANFYAIHDLFSQLYGHREDLKAQLTKLIKALITAYQARNNELKQLDFAREKDHNWFLSQSLVGYALYCKEFANDLTGLRTKLPYLEELGINLVHIMPILDCPTTENDGGYAVSDYQKINPQVGTNEDLSDLSEALKQKNMLLVLDVVVNHTSNQHAWAQAAQQGDKKYQDYYYTFEEREIPDQYEQSMPEIFPEQAPGNFTWNPEMEKWVMTVFNDYQWDLNYQNPAVLIEMISVILFWANMGADIVRLDAVAFLWKKIGTQCQNEHEAHLILQLMKDCCQVVAPGVLFIAEAIVAPVEVTKYFGEDAINAKECEIAYNATLMALLWDGVATKSTKLLNNAIKSIPDKLERTTWLNYVRCHDDIGLGFEDASIAESGYDPAMHRKFIIDYYTGNQEYSPARGVAFGVNEKNGDARIAGTLASLAGLEKALEQNDTQAIGQSIDTIILLHSVILSFGGIPLLYYGDDLGLLNDRSYLEDDLKKHDSRWVHRPTMRWDLAEKRNTIGTTQSRIFNHLKAPIAVRKTTRAFADYNTRTIIDVDNPHLFVFSRFDHYKRRASVLVLCNFDNNPQILHLQQLRDQGYLNSHHAKDLATGNTIALVDDCLHFKPLQFYWLTHTNV